MAGARRRSVHLGDAGSHCLGAKGAAARGAESPPGRNLTGDGRRICQGRFEGCGPGACPTARRRRTDRDPSLICPPPIAMQVPVSSVPPFVVPIAVSKQVIPCGIRSLKLNVFPFNLKGLLDTSSAVLDHSARISRHRGFGKIPAFLTNRATGSPQVLRLFFSKFVQLRFWGSFLK